MKLSAYFSLEELVFSDTAARLGIDNTPPPDVVARLYGLAYLLDEVRARLGRPVHVNSGYRAPALERVIVGDAFPRWCAQHDVPINEVSWLEYLKTKAHPDGRAADFTAREYGTPLQICREIADSDIAFDQLIFEHTWVHLGVARHGDKPRRQMLTLMPDGGYAFGILDKAAV